MIEDLVKHEIYASNLIIGQSMFFSLHLPSNWQLASGVGRPEVNATWRRSDEQIIVVNGNAWYVLFDSQRGWALEFIIHIRPLNKNNLNPTGEPVSVFGHPAQLSWKTRRRGLPWQRHDVTFMKVTFDCPRTNRRLELEFSGWCPSEGFQEILTVLRHLHCH